MISKKQYKFLKWLSNTPRKYNEIMKHLKLDQSQTNIFLGGLDSFYFRNYGIFTITEAGRAVVSEYRRNNITEVRYWVTTIIAVLAFIKSFFF